MHHQSLSIGRRIVVCAGVVGALSIAGGGATPGAQRRGSFTPASRIAVPVAGRDAAVPQIAARAGLTIERVQALAEAERRGLDYLPGEVLIKFRNGVASSGQQRALSALRSRPRAGDLRWIGNVARHRDALETDAVLMAAQLARQPEVEFAQPNYIRRTPARVLDRVRELRSGASTSGVPNDPDYRDLQWNFSLLDMPAAWDINPGGNSTIIVAVVDTGLTTTDTTRTQALWTGQQFETVTMPFAISSDLSPSRVAFPRDLVFEPGPVLLDFEGHGTHVASTIAQETNNQQSLAGLAYNVRVLPVKVCVGFWELMIVRAAFGVPGYLPLNAGACFTDEIAAGIRYAADNGANVINLSVGGDEASPIERDAILHAIGKGAFVAAAVGNEFERGNAQHFPAAYAPAIDGLMSVGAVGKSRNRAYYSSTGSHLEIVAPGGSDLDGGGEDDGYVWQVTLAPADQNPLLTRRPRFDRYAEVGYIGTSMAAPHVSATAALLMSQGIRDPRAVEFVIKSTALDLGPAGKDNEYGHGLVQPRNALFGMGIAR
jgi:serine protease